MITGPLRSVRDFMRLNMFSMDTRLRLCSIKIKYYTFKLLETTISRRWRCYNLQKQETLIGSGNYSALIILDACRYDVFEEVVYDYLDGTLKPVLSPASVTIDWLKRVWGRVQPDIIYVSASPMVNKRGLLREFDARGKFFDVIEVWDWGWNPSISTVPPDKVNLGVKIALMRARLRGLRYPRDFKVVIHYVQPHAPYVSLQKIISRITSHERLSQEIVDVAVRKLGRFAGRFSMDHILLGLLMEYQSSEVNSMLRKLYVHNLRWALRYVAEVSSHLGGRIIITADHGELLGEYGLYFHMDLFLPELRIVPWFVVK